MWTYQYKHGDRPLEGYTIERAAGRGGFGEVYYAVSDSGREVALKAVQGYEQIELRGISQCMNLKSPHLVSIFDVRHNDQGRPFVIMEYVNGPSLRQLLDDAPSGLGEQKSAFFLREIAKGLTFLHDCGIVHRDLKPGNIFYENGYVKIGDYGLSKAITIGQTSQQTVTVGTVHYMAPEIGAGKYDRSIDIYAMGAVLFEMLTGTVPHVGASPSEILMKHLSVEPDCTGIAEPFASVIKKAMHKDPSRRYQSVQEMVEAVFGTEHVRNSMSVFSPEDLSMVAGRVAQRINAAGSATPQAAESSSVVGRTPIKNATMWDRMGDRFDRAGDRVAQLGDGIFRGAGFREPPKDWDEATALDSMSKRDRRLLAVFTSLVTALAAGVMTSSSRSSSPAAAATVFLASWGATLGIIASWRWIMPKMGNDSSGARRFVSALLAVLGSVVLSSVAMTGLRDGPGLILAIAAAFLLVDTRRWIDPWRAERVRIKFAIHAGIVAMVASMFTAGGSFVALAVAAGTALMVQVLTPWDAQGAGVRRNTSDEAAAPPPVAPIQPTPVSPGSPINIDLGGRPAQQFAVATPPAAFETPSANPIASRVAPRWMRIACMLLFAGLFTGGVMLLIGASNRAFAPHADEEALARGFGVGMIIAATCCLFRAMIGRYVSFWQYIARPAMLMLCFESMVISSIVTSSTPNLQGDERMIGMFFIIFPAVLFVTIFLISWQLGGSTTTRSSSPSSAPSVTASTSPHNRSIATAMNLAAFVGVAGLHRLYVGKIGTGILWLCTWGLCGIGQLIDLLYIVCGEFTDAQGRKIVRWEDSTLATAPTQAFATVTGVAASAPMRDDRPWQASNFKEKTRQQADQFKNVMSGVDAKVREHTAYLRGRRATRTETGGPLSALAGFLVFAAVLLALGLALDATGFIAAGLPNPQVAKDVEIKLFQDPEWPGLMRKFGIAACGITMFIGLCATVFARRRGGFGYILRGIIGSVGLLLAMIPLSSLVPADEMWQEAAPLFQTRRISAGVNEVLSNFHGAPLYFSGGVFLVSLIFLSIPAPRKRRVGASRSTPSVQVRLQQRPTSMPPAPPAPPPPLSGNTVADSSNTEPSSTSSPATAETMAGEKGA